MTPRPRHVAEFVKIFPEILEPSLRRNVHFQPESRLSLGLPFWSAFNLKRMYIITAKRTIAGEILK